jgi:ATP-binding cassette subfamily C (CFTR/MRP) protein 4
LKLGLERPLVEKDLWELDTVDSSAYNLRHFEKIWQEERRLRPLNPNLAWALLKDFHKSTWIYVQPIFFLGYSARVVQAVVLGKLIESFEGLNDQGYLWAGSIVVCGLIVLCQSHHPFQIQWRKGMQTRIGSVFAIGQKSLRLSSTHQDTSNSYGKIMNLASNDAERFLLASVFLNQLFWAPAQAIAILLTGYFLFGIPFVIGWAVFVCFFVPVQIFLAIKFAQYRSQIAEITDQRVTFVAQAVNGVRVMKMSGYEWRFLDRIQKYREKEITKIRSSNRLKAWNDALFFVSNIVISLLIFLVRIWMDEALTTVAVFQIFALVNILQLEVARAAAIAIMVVSECYVSVGRIQKFLEFPELPQESEEDITERRVQRDSRLTPSKMDDVALELSRVRCYWNKVTKSAPMQSDFGRRASYLSQKPALDMINVAFMFGQLTAVIGPVGSGKTALLLALVGELPIQHGEVCRCYDELAYASQDPWIMDGTVMENILMDLDLDEIWYDKVIRACGLYTDFDQWRDGDQTKVGSQGVQCSGGQRARIGFARALYRDADVLVADDPLSAVDARVGRQLFCEAILGLCLNRGKCVILATHQHQHVKDHRCILVTDGRLRCIGTYDACIQSSHGKLTAQLPDTESHQWNGSRLGAVMEYNDEVEGQTKEASSAPLSASLRQSHTDDKSEEVIVQGLVSNETYLNYLRAMGGLHIGFVLFAFFSLTQTGVLLTLATVGRWAERPAEQQKDWDIIGLVLSLGFFVVIMAFCRAFLSFHLCIKATKLIHDKMAKSVLLARIEFFDTNPLGRIMNRFSADVGSNDDLLPPTLVEFFTLAFILAGTIVTAVINLPFVLLSLPPLWWYFAWVRKIFVTSSRELKRLECIARSPIYVELSQSLGGLATIRSNHTLDFFREKFVNVQEAHTRTVFAFIAASRWFGFRVDATMFLFLAVVCLGSVLFQEQGWFDVNPTILGLVVSFLLQFAGMFQWCMRLSAEAVNQMVSVERVLLFGQLESEAPLTLDTDKALVDRGWPVDARIEMRDLSARYRSNLPQTLKNVSFVVPAGCRVGVVGRTGSGKSTLIQALFRLLEADSGGITIDGVDISTLGLHTLRTQISVIPQTPTLFSGCSIRENLDLFNLHTDDEIDKVLFDCRLRPVVDFMPEGWDTLVTEGGQNFSVGQRQLLCLARAILSHCKILGM